MWCQGLLESERLAHLHSDAPRTPQQYAVTQEICLPILIKQSTMGERANIKFITLPKIIIRDYK